MCMFCGCYGADKKHEPQRRPKIREEDITFPRQRSRPEATEDEVSQKRSPEESPA